MRFSVRNAMILSGRAKNTQTRLNANYTFRNQIFFYYYFYCLSTAGKPNCSVTLFRILIGERSELMQRIGRIWEMHLMGHTKFSTDRARTTNKLHNNER